jgi:hypothetical protein
VFRSLRPWTNRDLATLRSLGVDRGSGYRVEPMTALRHPIPKGTAVVIVSSNSEGSAEAAREEAAPAAQRNLERFVHTGGVLVVDLADNLFHGGYRVPGASGTPTWSFPPFPRCGDATLTHAALGPDGSLGTADDHPFVIGPDGVAGTPDDVTERSVDLARGCAIAHGSLVRGISLPRGTTFLLTAVFGHDRQARPILGTFCLGRGRVIVDTVTKEFMGQQPFGRGPSNFMLALFAWALRVAAEPCHAAG